MFAEIFQNGLIQKHKQQQKERSAKYAKLLGEDNNVHPSGLTWCDLAIYYSMIGLKAEELEPPYNIFEYGIMMHEYMDQVALHCKEFKILDDGMPKKHPFLSLSGTTDKFVLMDGVKWILEFKGWRSTAWHYLKEPKRDHIHQIHGYMMIYGAENAMMIYINKAMFDYGMNLVDSIKEYPVQLDQNKADEITIKVSNIQDCVEKKKEPEVNKAHQQCNSCGYRYKCYNTVKRGKITL